MTLAERAIGSVLGAVYRTGQHILLTAILFGGLALTIPFKLLLSAYQNNHTWHRILAEALFFTFVVTPIAIGIASLLAACVILASAILSPIIGLVEGFTKGLKGAFESTWLTKGLGAIFRDYFKISDRPSRQHEYHVIQRSIRAIQPERIDPRPHYAACQALFAQPEPLPDGWRQVHIRRNNEHAINDNEAKFQRDLAQATQLSVASHVEHEQLMQQRQAAEEVEKQRLAALAVERQALEAKNQDPFNLFKRIVNLYLPAGPQTIQANKLADILEVILPNTQSTIQFLDTIEINKLIEFKEEKTNSTLDNYLQLLKKRTCFFTTEDLNELSQPVTVEIKKPILNPTTKTSRLETFYITHEQEDFIRYLRRAAQSDEIPEIVGHRPERFDAEFILTGKYKNILSGTNLTGVEIKIYRGIDEYAHTQLNQYLHIMRDRLLFQTVRSTRPSFSTFISKISANTHPDLMQHRNSISLNPTTQKQMVVSTGEQQPVLPFQVPPNEGEVPSQNEDSYLRKLRQL